VVGGARVFRLYGDLAEEDEAAIDDDDEEDIDSTGNAAPDKAPASIKPGETPCRPPVDPL
jgi:hypothetical protein